MSDVTHVERAEVEGGAEEGVAPVSSHSAPTQGICGIGEASETLVLQRLLLDKAPDSRKGTPPALENQDQALPSWGIRSWSCHVHWRGKKESKSP